MKAYGISMMEMKRALDDTNKRYKGNLAFRYLVPDGRGVSFTLTVKDSKALGHRRGQSGKRLACACWHGHGDFFESVFKIVPAARIVSRSMGVTITKHGGNWQDKNIGSIMYPLFYSEACDCNT